MVPSRVMTHVLTGVAKLLPKSKLVPQKNIADLAFRDLKNRDLVCVHRFSQTLLKDNFVKNARF